MLPCHNFLFFLVTLFLPLLLGCGNRLNIHRFPTRIEGLKWSHVLTLMSHTYVFPGSISALIRWPRPRDDGDATVSGYQVFVDGKRHGEPLAQSALQTHVKVRNY